MNMFTRRDLLRSATAGTAMLLLPGSLILAQDKKEEKKATGFTLPKLPYAVDALEPHIDAKTMEIHHGRHHQAYVDNLNKAIGGDAAWLAKSLEDISKSLKDVPEKIRGAVRNNGGGHLNHSWFWQMMAPAGKGGKPSDTLAKAITAAFKDMETMQANLKAAALARFGSGWGWLVVDNLGKLAIQSSPNQDNPLMDGSGTPILGIDVWEHAYYLKYQNKRADYVDNFFKVVNWEYVNMLFDKAMKS
jgi:Fe-Mn family superoxide dismutase